MWEKKSEALLIGTKNWVKKKIRVGIRWSHWLIDWLIVRTHSTIISAWPSHDRMQVHVISDGIRSYLQWRIPFCVEGACFADQPRGRTSDSADYTRGHSRLSAKFGKNFEIFFQKRVSQREKNTRWLFEQEEWNLPFLPAVFIICWSNCRTFGRRSPRRISRSRTKTKCLPWRRTAIRRRFPWHNSLEYESIQ